MMQKFCMLFLMVFTNSVASKEILPTAINFDIKAGQYEEFQLLTWKPKDTTCIALTLISTNEDTQWLPVAGIFFQGEKEGEYASIRLLKNSFTSNKLSLIYTTFADGKKDQYLIRENIEYGQRVIYELRFPRRDDYDIHIDGGVGQLKSPFEFSKLTLSSSSVKSVIELDTAACNQ